MTRERLQSISLEELATMARSEGLEIDETPDKGALVEFLLENHEERRSEHNAENNAAVRVEEAKYEITEAEEPEGCAPQEEALGSTGPCGQTKIVLMARDPHWAFAYWQIEEKRMLRLAALPDPPPLLLRVHEASAGAAFDIPVQMSDSSWYIYLPNDNSEYCLELGYLAAGRFHHLAASNKVSTPRETFADPEFADAGQQIIGMLSALDVLKSPSSGESIPQRILSSLRD
jgi:hypothetical protein